MKIHIVKLGETLYELSKKYGIELKKLLAANPQIEDPEKINVGTKVKIPSAPTPMESPPPGIKHKHVVQQGDTLWKLSKTWNVPLQEIIKANPHLKHPNVLMTGEIVYIPHKGHHAEKGKKEIPILKELKHKLMDVPNMMQNLPSKELPNILPNVMPNLPSNVMPNISPNEAPNIPPNMMPNIPSNIMPNISPNVMPNISPNVMPNLPPNLPKQANEMAPETPAEHPFSQYFIPAVEADSYFQMPASPNMQNGSWDMNVFPQFPNAGYAPQWPNATFPQYPGAFPAMHGFPGNAEPSSNPANMIQPYGYHHPCSCQQSSHANYMPAYTDAYANPMMYTHSYPYGTSYYTGDPSMYPGFANPYDPFAPAEGQQSADVRTDSVGTESSKLSKPSAVRTKKKKSSAPKAEINVNPNRKQTRQARIKANIPWMNV